MSHPKDCNCVECPDPDERWYFALLPPDWKTMTHDERVEYGKTMDEPTKAECRRRLEMRRLVSRGKALARQQLDRERRLWHGRAVDAALYRILLRAQQYQASRSR